MTNDVSIEMRAWSALAELYHRYLTGVWLCRSSRCGAYAARFDQSRMCPLSHRPTGRQQSESRE
jgi:hypothetical protein